ncbi:Oidioi.mRNA.OKI2018_I69.chr2.g3978.t1.cds [Oikopleura dioica]|uniref:Oidioi.mRNA.OKI2018_I69.chr2.g3978.t1.cds n=1 Tax=Oikopleura dioica TaxID=34765 RepID=A0ABN7SVR3_OIKDI|nr:Oidioi.mRNA.OKI2018_I69.chr2.g3978.t1.cds [Oikopleura dioica]
MTDEEMGNAQDANENMTLTTEQEKPQTCLQRALSCSCTILCVVFGISLGVGFGLPFGYLAAFLFAIIAGPLYCCGYRFDPATTSVYKKGQTPPQAPAQNV